MPAALEAGRTNSRGFLAAPAFGTTGTAFSFPVFVLAVVVLLVGWPWARVVVCCWLVMLAGTEGCCWGAVAVPVTDLDAVGCRGGAENRRLYMAALLAANGSATSVCPATAANQTQHVARTVVERCDEEAIASFAASKFEMHQNPDPPKTPGSKKM